VGVPKPKMSDHKSFLEKRKENDCESLRCSMKRKEEIDLKVAAVEEYHHSHLFNKNGRVYVRRL